jgi:hypothetical protein
METPTPTCEAELALREDGKARTVRTGTSEPSRLVIRISFTFLAE